MLRSDPGKINLLPMEGDLYYYESLYDQRQANDLFLKLKADVQWRQETIRMFGKNVMQPRLTAWCGEEGLRYVYSGLQLFASGWSDDLQEIRSRIENLTEQTFNSVLLNYYRDGNDSIGWHRDNERELGQSPVIASLSLGAVRKFSVRRYKSHEHRIDLYPANGSLLLMKGPMQQHWEHAVPKEKSVTEGRINLTFRKII